MIYNAFSRTLNLTQSIKHNRFTALFPGPPAWAGARRELLDFVVWCKGRLTEADTQTIRLGATPSRLTSPNLHDPSIFYRPDACPSCRPTNSVKALKATCAFGLGRRR